LCPSFKLTGTGVAGVQIRRIVTQITQKPPITPECSGLVRQAPPRFVSTSSSYATQKYEFVVCTGTGNK